MEMEDLDPDKGKSGQQVIDEMTGQLSLFDDEDM
jgi:topoisomerase-4 subunit A